MWSRLLNVVPLETADPGVTSEDPDFGRLGGRCPRCWLPHAPGHMCRTVSGRRLFRSSVACIRFQVHSQTGSKGNHAKSGPLLALARHVGAEVHSLR